MNTRFSLATFALGLMLASAATPLVAKSNAAPGATETAVFAGGCFWGLEAVFEHVNGVRSVVAGYSGGSKESAQYETVSTGRTGHAESVSIAFDPKKISYARLLDVFFTVAHDPTEVNRQGPDEGTQYRSAIFFTSEAQHREAVRAIAKLAAQKTYAAPIATQVVAYRAFFPPSRITNISSIAIRTIRTS